MDSVSIDRDRAGRDNALVRLEFEYASLNGELAARLKEAAARIRKRVTRQVADAIAIGLELTTAKESLRHGEFAAWVYTEFRMPETTARNYMRLAKVFGAETATVAGLPLRGLYLLASPRVAPSLREAVIERMRIGERPTIDAIKELIGSKSTRRLRSSYSEVAAEPRESLVPVPATMPLRDAGAVPIVEQSEQTATHAVTAGFADLLIRKFADVPEELARAVEQVDFIELRSILQRRRVGGAVSVGSEHAFLKPRSMEAQLGPNRHQVPAPISPDGQSLRTVTADRGLPAAASFFSVDNWNERRRQGDIVSALNQVRSKDPFVRKTGQEKLKRLGIDPSGETAI